MKMNLIEAQGYNKAKAYEQTGLDVDLSMLKNATQAWKKQGSPINSKDMQKFLSNYIKEKRAVGAYIVVDPASDDTRTRPYTIINEVTAGRRKATTVYQVKEATMNVKYHKATRVEVDKETGEEKVIEYLTPYNKETITVVSKDKETGEKIEKQKEIEVPNVKVVDTGAVSGRADRKDQALKLMKELIEANKKDYVVEIVKEITDGQKYAGYGQYTPSKSAKKGKFVFAVNAL
jgi:hypothetical protein